MNKIDYVLDRKIKIKLDASMLRIIAMATMLIDHFAFMIIGNGVLYGYDQKVHEVALSTTDGKSWYVLYVILRTIGRISFPIFCFLLVEGFVHTKNLFKYMLRVLFLAIVSEIPFNLVCGNAILYPMAQNTVFTFFLGLLMLFFIKKIEKMSDDLRITLTIFILALSCITSYYLKLDYNVAGMILIFLIYHFYTDKNIKILSVALISFIISFVEKGSYRYFGFGALAALILLIYNGKPGFLHKYMWVYYLFYPLHLIILYGVVFITYLK